MERFASSTLLPPRLTCVLQCEATPWLLPARTKVLPYAGVKAGGDLLALRAKPFGGYSKTISIFFFNRAYVEMTQNYGEHPTQPVQFVSCLPATEPMPEPSGGSCLV